jgi:hypothetical protein
VGWLDLTTSPTLSTPTQNVGLAQDMSSMKLSPEGPFSASMTLLLHLSPEGSVEVRTSPVSSVATHRFDGAATHETDVR